MPIRYTWPSPPPAANIGALLANAHVNTADFRGMVPQMVFLLCRSNNLISFDLLVPAKTNCPLLILL